MLAAKAFYQDKSGPWIVWLHGLLGSADEWLPIVDLCANHPSLLIDLPGHGESVNVACAGFEQADQLIRDTIAYNQITEYWLVGYSLGGRLAMYHACNNQPSVHSTAKLKGLIIEGGHVGLSDPDEKIARQQHDHQWADAFRHQSLTHVLARWYQQPVFAQLTEQQRQHLIEKRRYNQGAAIADMLESTSLSQQPFLADKLRHQERPFIYLCGEQDTKFRQMSQQFALPLQLIPATGHNVHQADPIAFADAINQFLSHCG